MTTSATVRSVSPDEDLVHVTKIIHATYADRASADLRYWAPHQTVEMSRPIRLGTAIR